MKPIDQQYDCVVMGGGPAGSTVATLVAKAGFSTLQIERDRFPRRHVGESLMPDSYFVFERLGILGKLKQSGYAQKVGVQFVNPDLKKAAIWGHFRGAKRDVEHGGVYTIVLHTNQRQSWFWYIPQANDVVSVGVVGGNDYLLKRGVDPKAVFFEEVAKCAAMQQRLEGAEIPAIA